MNDNLLAIYAAVVATIGLAWHIYVGLRDRARVVLRYSTDMRLISYRYHPDTDYLILRVTNRGRRPVNVTQAGAVLYRGQPKAFIFSSSFFGPAGRLLTEESPSTDFACEQSQVDVTNIEYFWAQDATGRTYRKYLRRFPTVRRLLRKLKRRAA